MKSRNINLVLFTLLFLFSAALAEEQKFCLLTIPKSGTGLVTKFLDLTTNRQASRVLYRNTFTEGSSLASKYVKLSFNGCWKKNTYPFAHLNCMGSFTNYLDSDPDWICILQIRDLRDACISMVYWAEGHIKIAMKKTPTFDEALLFVINSNENAFKNTIFNLQAHAEAAVLHLDHPQVFLMRFEDLVGANGGGSDESQIRLILSLANKLHLSIVDYEGLCKDLWGNEKGPKKVTFREGKIGGWKTAFTDEHKAAFKKQMGDYLIQLGYEKDNDW